jgi:hypothetical protein
MEKMGEGNYIGCTPKTFYQIDRDAKQIIKYEVTVSDMPEEMITQGLTADQMIFVGWIGGEENLARISYNGRVAVFPFDELF